MVMQALVLLVDDEYERCLTMQQTLARIGLKTHIAHHIAQAKYFFNEYHYQACITELHLLDGSGTDLTAYLAAYFPQIPTIAICSASDLDTIPTLMQAGAFDCISRPFTAQQLQQLTRRALHQYPLMGEQRPQSLAEKILIGESTLMQSLRNSIEKLADSQSSVFIHGESGTGKSVVAQLIHQLSSRCDEPFVLINCDAISEHQMDIELFGQQKGHLPDVKQDSIGLLQTAHRGSLFLDEIAALSPTMQLKLHHALQHKKIRPLGSDQDIEVDFRLLSASHLDLQQQLRQGLFRPDLYYRVHVVDLYIPPLGAREQDILILANHFIQELCIELNIGFKQLSSTAQSYLMEYTYAGNVRELSNMIERALVLCDGSTIEVAHLQPSPPPQVTTQAAAQSITQIMALPTTYSTLSDITSHRTVKSMQDMIPTEGLVQFLENIEREILINALHLTRWNRTQAAKKLGMTFRSLRYRLKKLGVE
ncbi:two-component system response regulator PilR (NtrC family) [Acinetobacter calcoaceticus]|uniref:Two-component system response regulator PilR (NtrC family) n=1 Tax=Acinetobacter calcoaceticus TaxID=471 RepID=A0A4R1Y455_ACICA|nr:two-component system response regulator PilR (NtrC family) [Acinetobacter calcoaceticus]